MASKRMARLDVYKDSKGEWRWRVRAQNGKVMADSAEGYKARGSCRHAAMRILDPAKVVMYDEKGE
jgi:uncharacterized protein YegP (UPF0339 family)